MRLSDGRLLGYAEYGDPRGAPVLALHGLPGSRFQRHPDESIAARLGARLIVFERPGFGLSGRAPRASLLERAKDAAALADALGLARFRLLAISGGAPVGCACALALGDRIERLALVCGVGPPADRRVLARSDVRAMFAADLRAAFAQGVGGFIDDLVLSARPWGFEPRSIRATTDIWQGEADPIVPPAAARALAAIPGSRLRLFADEGHYFVFERWEEILASLLR